MYNDVVVSPSLGKTFVLFTLEVSSTINMCNQVSFEINVVGAMKEEYSTKTSTTVICHWDFRDPTDVGQR